MRRVRTTRKFLPGAALLVLGASAPAPRQEPLPTAAQEHALDERLPIGMNLRTVTPRDREWVFADALRLASPWQYVDEGGFRPRAGAGRGPRRREQVEHVPLDELGWPLPEEGRTIACAVFTDMRGAYPGGEYVCTWKGSGRIELERAARVIERGDHRLRVHVDPAAGEIVLRVEESDPEDPVRELHLWLPGLENASSAFHPLFLERLRPFSVLRFYPWMRPYTASGSWVQRTTLASARQSGPEGVALEHMIALCNELEAEPWFTLPHRADDEYVREFARLVRDTLHPGARVWVELSNELWNTGLPAGSWVQEETRRRGLRTAELVAEHAARMFRIWREVFGEQAGRVVRVAAGHLHNPGYTRALCWGLDEELDAIAVGAYFGVRPEKDGSGPDASAGELLARARANLEELVLPRLAEHASLARAVSGRLGREVPLVAYEGGPSIVSRVDGGASALDVRATYECASAPEMYAAYRRLLSGARESGLELFVAYDFVGANTPADTFGHLQALDQPLDQAPKYRALTEGWRTEAER